MGIGGKRQCEVRSRFGRNFIIIVLTHTFLSDGNFLQIFENIQYLHFVATLV